MADTHGRNRGFEYQGGDTLKLNSFDTDNLSVGSGPSIEVGIGYFFNEFIGAEVTTSVGAPKINIVSKEVSFGSENITRRTFWANYFPTVFSIVLKKDFDNWNVFMSYGLLVSKMTKYNVNVTYEEVGQPIDASNDQDFDYHDIDIAYGTQSRAGITYAVSSWFSINSYLFSRNGLHKPSSLVIDRRGDDTFSAYEVIFVDEPGTYVDEGNSVEFSTNTPFFSISSWGIGIGFLWNIL